MSITNSKNHNFNISQMYNKLITKSDIKSPDIHSNNVTLDTGFYIILFTVLWNGIMLYYLHTLENETCKCFRDWRHNFMKYIAYLNITLSLLPVLITITYNKYFLILLGIIVIVLNGIYIYAYYTYITILNTTNCSCALVNEKYLNDLLYYRKNSMVILYILGIITILLGINVSLAMTIHTKTFTINI